MNRNKDELCHTHLTMNILELHPITSILRDSQLHSGFVFVSLVLYFSIITLPCHTILYLLSVSSLSPSTWKCQQHRLLSLFFFTETQNLLKPQYTSQRSVSQFCTPATDIKIHPHRSINRQQVLLYSESKNRSPYWYISILFFSARLSCYTM